MSNIEFPPLNFYSVPNQDTPNDIPITNAEKLEVRDHSRLLVLNEASFTLGPAYCTSEYPQREGK